MTNRAARRKLKRRAGALYVERIVVERSAISEAVSQSASPVDLVMHHVDAALSALVEQGADVLEHAVVLVGRHPDYPLDITIEAKSDATIKATPELGE